MGKREPNRCRTRKRGQGSERPRRARGSAAHRPARDELASRREGGDEQAGHHAGVGGPRALGLRGGKTGKKKTKRGGERAGGRVKKRAGGPRRASPFLRARSGPIRSGPIQSDPPIARSRPRACWCDFCPVDTVGKSITATSAPQATVRLSCRVCRSFGRGGCTWVHVGDGKRGRKEGGSGKKKKGSLHLRSSLLLRGGDEGPRQGWRSRRRAQASDGGRDASRRLPRGRAVNNLRFTVAGAPGGSAVEPRRDGTRRGGGPPAQQDVSLGQEPARGPSEATLCSGVVGFPGGCSDPRNLVCDDCGDWICDFGKIFGK